MKKIFSIALVVLTLFTVGCGKTDEENVLKKLTNKINNLNAYELSGKLEIVNNDETYDYEVNVSYAKNDKYKVSLKNLANNHEQVILKNDDGVYVLTPSLNKSFKFQSDWPYNNSQVYLLKSIVDDLNNDKETIKETTSDGYLLTSKVNYQNNNQLVKQKVKLDKNLNIKEAVVVNNDGIPQMTMTFEDIDYKPQFTENHFEISDVMNSVEINEENNKEVTTLDDIIYPLYIPTNTVLTDQEKVAKTDGERIILTFEGEKPFLLVEETVTKEEELTTIPTYGEPYLLIDTVGSLTDNSISWISNGIEYYIVSDVMSQNELLEVAKSISTIPVMK